MSTTPVELLLSRLPDAKKSGKGWSVRCPAHDDRQASLSISEGDNGGAILFCHAGCSAEAVVVAVRLTLRDLMPSDNGNGHHASGGPGGKAFATAADAIADLEKQYGPRSATWNYHDAAGQVMGVVVRWDLSSGKKDIRPVSLFSDGWHVKGMQEPRPLYQLPTLANAQRVYVCEGEKAADAARSIGLTATTTPHGAKSAGKADWSPLAGKDVVLLPDADKPGREYSATVTAILGKLTPPAIVKVVELPGLPDGGDMVEFIGNHGDAAEPDDMRA